jgi:hypothetical protein
VIDLCRAGEPLCTDSAPEFGGADPTIVFGASSLELTEILSHAGSPAAAAGEFGRPHSEAIAKAHWPSSCTALGRAPSA